MRQSAKEQSIHKLQYTSLSADIHEFATAALLEDRQTNALAGLFGDQGKDTTRRPLH